MDGPENAHPDAPKRPVKRKSPEPRVKLRRLTVADMDAIMAIRSLPQTAILRIDEVAIFCQCDRLLALQAIKAGLLRAVPPQNNHTWRLRVSWVLEWVDAGMPSGAPPKKNTGRRPKPAVDDLDERALAIVTGADPVDDPPAG